MDRALTPGFEPEPSRYVPEIGEYTRVVEK